MSEVRNVAEVLGRKLQDGRYRGLPGYAEVDPLGLLQYLLAALGKLIDCFPRPEDAWAELAWRPYRWAPFSALRLRWHRDGLRDRLGRDSKARVFCECVFRAVDDGDVGAENLRRAYAETRGAR